MDDRDAASRHPSRRHEQARARCRPRAVDIEDPRTIPAPGRRSRRSAWTRTTTSPDARVQGRGPRGTRAS